MKTLILSLLHNKTHNPSLLCIQTLPRSPSVTAHENTNPVITARINTYPVIAAHEYNHPGNPADENTHRSLLSIKTLTQSLPRMRTRILSLLRMKTLIRSLLRMKSSSVNLDSGFKVGSNIWETHCALLPIPVGTRVPNNYGGSHFDFFT